MQTRSARFAFVLMAFLSVAVALSSERFVAVLFGTWISIDIGIRSVIEAFPLRALVHMIIAPLALLVGPFQFIASLRTRAPRVHRILGRIYVAACVIAGVAGFATALHASGGPVASWGFGTLAVLWVGSTAWALWAALQRNFAAHRLLMRISYALTFSAVTLRLQIPVFVLFGQPQYTAMSVWLAWTCWIPNLVAVLVWTASQQGFALRLWYRRAPDTHEILQSLRPHDGRSRT